MDDECTSEDVEKFNNYLSSDDLYDKAGQRLEETNPTFIHADIYKADFDRNFDNLWLSNIVQFADLKTARNLIDRLSAYQNNGGSTMVCYLFDTPGAGLIKSDNYPIYDLDTTFKEFSDYSLQLITFDGSSNSHYCNKSKDSVLVHRKNK